MQDLDWNGVRDFLAVARTGSLAGASKTLGVNASTVGRRIEALESELGIRLFQRAQTGYALSDEGRELIERAEVIETAAHAFVQRAGAGAGLRGRVRLATAENLANFVLIPAMQGFKRRYPDLVLEIITDVRSVNLHRREADLALRLVRPTHGNVTIQKVGLQNYGLYGSSAYVATRQAIESNDPSEETFEQDRFIAWSDAFVDLPAAQLVERKLKGRTPAVVLSSLYAQFMAARAGLGLAVLPRFLAATEPDLRHVPSEADAIEESLWLVTHADLASSARVQAVARFVRKTVENL